MIIRSVLTFLILLVFFQFVSRILWHFCCLISLVFLFFFPLLSVSRDRLVSGFLVLYFRRDRLRRQTAPAASLSEDRKSNWPRDDRRPIRRRGAPKQRINIKTASFAKDRDMTSWSSPNSWSGYPTRPDSTRQVDSLDGSRLSTCRVRSGRVW